MFGVYDSILVPRSTAQMHIEVFENTTEVVKILLSDFEMLPPAWNHFLHMDFGQLAHFRVFTSLECPIVGLAACFHHKCKDDTLKPTHKRVA